MSAGCWTLNVMRAFADAMDAVRPADVPRAFVGWPTLQATREGPWSPFVWFEEDGIDAADAADNHALIVVTGVVIKRDPSVTTATELEQAIGVYYLLRAALAQQADDDTSAFNAAFIGFAVPDAERGGVRPSGADDYDGVCTLGERWRVNGRGGPTGDPES